MVAYWQFYVAQPNTNRPWGRTLTITHSSNKHVPHTHHKPSAVLSSHSFPDLGLWPQYLPLSVSVSLPQLSFLWALYSSQPLSASPCCRISPVGSAFPEIPAPPPHCCLSAPSPASEEHVWTRVPSEVRGEEKEVLGPAGWCGGAEAAGNEGGVSAETSPHTAGIWGL